MPNPEPQNPIPPEGCICASFWTVRQAHKTACPLYKPQSQEIPINFAENKTDIDRFLWWALFKFRDDTDAGRKRGYYMSARHDAYIEIKEELQALIQTQADRQMLEGQIKETKHWQKHREKRHFIDKTMLRLRRLYLENKLGAKHVKAK